LGKAAASFLKIDAGSLASGLRPLGCGQFALIQAKELPESNFCSSSSFRDAGQRASVFATVIGI